MNNIFDDKIDAAFKSLDGISKASPQPFLLTRINAGINNIGCETVWSQIAFYLKKPVVCAVALLLLVCANFIVINKINHNTEIESLTKSAASPKYDFAINVSVLYDIENQEP